MSSIKSVDDLNEIDLAWLNGARFALMWTLGKTRHSPDKVIDWWTEAEKRVVNFTRKSVMTRKH